MGRWRNTSELIILCYPLIGMGRTSPLTVPLYERQILSAKGYICTAIAERHDDRKSATRVGFDISGTEFA